MYWDVIEVKPEKNCTLWVRFADQTKGRVKFTEQYLSGVFEPIKDPNFFNQVFISEGVVSWPGELDLAPDAMYKEIQAKGEWILD